MNKWQLGIIVAVVLAGTQSAHAATREFNDLLYYEGVWECEGKALDATGKSLRDVSSIYAATAMVESNWLQATIFEQEGAAAVHIGSRMMGWDATWKRYVSYEASRDGAWSFISSADGMYGSEEWSGYLHNFQGKLAQPLEESVRRVSDDAFTVISKVQDSSGTWTTVYDGSCHRQN